MFGRYGFKGGVHLSPHHSETRKLSIETLPGSAVLSVPLADMSGAAAKPIVKRGDSVQAGQCIAEAGDGSSSVVHAPVSGTVRSIGPAPHPIGKQVMAIELENHGLDTFDNVVPFGKSWREAAPGELVQKIIQCGVINMDGSGAPIQTKLLPSSNTAIDTLICSALECEPYLCGCTRLLIEKIDEIFTGALIVRKILGARKVIIALDAIAGDACDAAQKKAADERFREFSIVKLKNSYPQDHERLLTTVLTKREVPAGGTAAHAGCCVLAVSTVYAIWDAIIRGVPLVQRVVSVDGPGIGAPRNLLVRIGTPLKDLLDFCQADMTRISKVVMGGHFTGVAQADLSVPVLKSTTGCITCDTVTAAVRDFNCIGCTHCVKSCPMGLVPSMLVRLIENGHFHEARRWGLEQCIECGCCSYVCPSKINLVHWIRLGKYRLERETVGGHAV